MLPWVYDFRWEPAHLVFLGAFFGVLATLLSLLVLAGLRTGRTIRQGAVEALRWSQDFEELPASSRVCRHELTGEIAQRTCPSGFDCRICEPHAQFCAIAPEPDDAAAADADGSASDVLGFPMPADRLYHRGHTWVRPEPDGTLKVGLDAFASRLIGTPERVIAPSAGSRVVVNGPAWRMRKGTAEARILSPVDGEVTGHGRDVEGWYLTVRPAEAPFDGRHLLAGAEVGPWIRREVERLQLTLSTGLEGTPMVDGGIPIEDLDAAIPEDLRDEVFGEMLLEP